MGAKLSKPASGAARHWPGMECRDPGERGYPNNPKVIADINTVGRYLNAANDGLVQAAKDENGK
ncbi:MAG: hypothetical protein WDM87_13845 [Terracidiphilus sp.]